MDYKTDLWVSTHRFGSILSIETLEITDNRIILSIWTNWWNRWINFYTSWWWKYNLIVKPRNIWDLYVQSCTDIDSGTWSMKNFYYFENIFLPQLWDHWKHISLVPDAIKKELNLSQKEYTQRIQKLGNVTTLQEVWLVDKELELAMRKIIKNNRIHEWLITPTVMWIDIWEKDFDEIDEDILDYCVRRDIPLVKVKY